MLRFFLRKYYVRGLHRLSPLLKFFFGNRRLQESGMGVKLVYQLTEPNELFSFFYFVDDLYVRTWQQYLRPGDAFIDVGANVGFYSAHAARFVGENGRVLAFEPNPRMIQRLEENLLNNSLGNVEVVEHAASDQSSEATLLVGCEHGLTRLKNKQDIVSGIEVAQEIGVTTVRIDNLASKLGQRAVRGIKLDIEGHEYLALRGARSTIENHRPLVQMEFNPYLMKQFQIDPESVFTFFHEVDYVAKIPCSPSSLLFHKIKVELREFSLQDISLAATSDVWWCPREAESELLRAWESKQY